MKSFADRNPYLIGSFSVLAIAAAVGVAFAAGILRWFDDTYAVRAVFSDAGGIRAGDDVRVAGVKAGRVESVKADRRAGNVVVTLQVNAGVDLGPRTSAEIALETLLGTKFVRLAGPVGEPLLEETPARERTIPLSRTKTPFDVFELTRIGTRAVQETDTAKLNRFITDLADITEGKQEELRKLLEGIARISTALTERDTQLRSLLDHAETLSGTLAEKDQTLVGLIDQSRGVLSLVERRRDDVAAAFSSGAGAVDELAGVVRRSKTDLDAILTTLHPTVDILDRKQADVDRSLAWLGPGALGLAKAPAHGPWADIYVRAVGPDLICTIRQSRGLPC